MSLVVLDTDVVSSILRQRTTDRLDGLLATRIPALTFVNIGELGAWVGVRRWGPRRIKEMRSDLGPYAVLPYDRKVAECWGDLQTYAQLRGRPIQANDAWIAACCIVRGLPLATLNTKDFVDFAEHEGLELVPVS